MKWLKPLAIFISVGLNACAGNWHDYAPYVAWPATNHLRWVDNVGVYTNASNPTNPAYAGWTNNFLISDWYYGTSGAYVDQSAFYLVPFYIWDWGYGDSISTQVMLNAKDARVIDATLALQERFPVIPSDTGNDYGYSTTNFWIYFVEAAGYGYASASNAFDHDWLYRDEVKNLSALKAVARLMLDKFGQVTYTNGVPYFTAWTLTSLCSVASVPTNFFDYTPPRSADTSATHYQRIITNTFMLRQGTNSTHEATNNLVDSAGTEFIAIGTNGQSVTRYATNVNQQVGYNIGAYGWDGLRRVITNYYATKKSQTWGIGTLTNWSEVAGTNFSVMSPSNFNSGAVNADVVIADVKADNTATHANLPYTPSGTPTVDEWGWTFTLTSSPSVVLKTNTAPYFTASAMGGHVQYLYASHRCYVYRDTTGLPWHYGPITTLWTVDADTRTWYRTNNVNWVNNSSPLVHASGLNEMARTVIHCAKSNGTQFVVSSNYYGAGVSSITSGVFVLTQPVLTNFWFDYYGDAWEGGDGWEFSYPSGAETLGGDAYISSFRGTIHTNYLGSIDYGGGMTITTNFTSPTITASDAIEIWDFDYD